MHFQSQDPGIFGNDFLSGPPEVSCPYESPDQCNCFEPQSCCERLAAGDNAVKPTGCPVTASATPIVTLINAVCVIGCSTLLSVLLAEAS